LHLLIKFLLQERILERCSSKPGSWKPLLQNRICALT
jgi:hypothetical protein